MSYKFDALISILNWMESGQIVTPQYIQEQLAISERTSFRYIQTLEGAGLHRDSTVLHQLKTCCDCKAAG